ncbi:MAG: hypothetical protein HC923_12335 [Myxococcales bacterium]|nr:hypothetical protein [Myxococcales bacterium]
MGQQGMSSPGCHGTTVWTSAMPGRWFAVVAFALAATACGREQPDEDWGCCYYRCVGPQVDPPVAPRVDVFSSFFGSEAECEAIGKLRCEQFYQQQIEDGVPGVTEAAAELDAFVWVDFPERDPSTITESSDEFPGLCESREPPAGFEGAVN